MVDPVAVSEPRKPLNTAAPTPPAEALPTAVFPENVLLVMAAVPLFNKPAPMVDAVVVVLETAHWFSVSVAPTVFEMPAPTAALLAVTTQLESVSVPSLRTPPPPQAGSVL